MFKSGDKLLCIDDSCSSLLKKDEEYTFEEYYYISRFIILKEFENCRFLKDRFKLISSKKHEGLLYYGTDKYISQAYENEESIKESLNIYGIDNLDKATEVDIYELHYVKSLKKTPVEKTIAVQEWK